MRRLTLALALLVASNHALAADNEAALVAGLAERLKDLERPARHPGEFWHVLKDELVKHIPSWRPLEIDVLGWSETGLGLKEDPGYFDDATLSLVLTHKGKFRVMDENDSDFDDPETRKWTIEDLKLGRFTGGNVLGKGMPAWALDKSVEAGADVIADAIGAMHGEREIKAATDLERILSTKAVETIEWIWKTAKLPKPKKIEMSPQGLTAELQRAGLLETVLEMAKRDRLERPKHLETMTSAEMELAISELKRLKAENRDPALQRQRTDQLLRHLAEGRGIGAQLKGKIDGIADELNAKAMKGRRLPAETLTLLAGFQPIAEGELHAPREYERLSSSRHFLALTGAGEFTIVARLTDRYVPSYRGVHVGANVAPDRVGFRLLSSAEAQALKDKAGIRPGDIVDGLEATFAKVEMKGLRPLQSNEWGHRGKSYRDETPVQKTRRRAGRFFKRLKIF